MAFCRPAIDQLNHHPEWTNVYNRLEVRLRTHDAGNRVTEKDKQLAVLLDQKYQEFLSV
jgi:4a-hydroxytetrahydrobiopterin dehydratase